MLSCSSPSKTSRIFAPNSSERSYYSYPGEYDPDDDPYQVYVPPEGKVILLFTKAA